MSDSDNKRTLDIKYVFDDAYNPDYINGVYGGITGKGEIMLHFFMERTALPRAQKVEIKQNEDGSLNSDIIEHTPENIHSKMIRYIQSGIVMTYSDALSIRNFLDQKIDDLEKHFEAIEKIENNKSDDTDSN